MAIKIAYNTVYQEQMPKADTYANRLFNIFIQALLLNLDKNLKGICGVFGVKFLT